MSSGVAVGQPPSPAIRDTIGSSREPPHAPWDGADAGELAATAVRMTGQERGRASGHDAGLLRELHEQHGDALWTYALRLTGDRGRAQNVVQETLLRAWRNPQILDPECGSQRSWLYSVARNIAEQPNGDASGQGVPRHVVAAALGRLTQEHRDVLRECYFRGSSVAEAALELGIAPDTVKARTYYALRALRLAIDELRGVE